MSNFFDQQLSFIQPVPLRPDRSAALVVVDLQYHDASADHGFTRALEMMQPGSMSYYTDRLENSVIPATRRLIDGFHDRGMPVIYLTLGSDYADYRDFAPRFRGWLIDFETKSGITGIFWSGNPAFEIRRELAPQPQDVVLRKRTFSAFNSSDFEPYLRYTEISTLVIAGVTTNACVESTARDAADRGFGCILVDDATADYDQAAHDASLSAFYFNFGRIGRSDAVLAAIDDGTAI